MHGFKGERTLMRIHLGERDKHHGRPLCQAIVVEAVETEERIQAILPELDAMIGGGLITRETVRVIMYRPELKPGEPEGT
jgi:PII-like signaling protein